MDVDTNWALFVLSSSINPQNFMTQFHPRKENRRIEDSRVSNWDFSSQGKFDLLHLKLDFVVVMKVVIDIEMKSLIYAMHPRSEVEIGGAWIPLSAASGGAWRRV